MNKPMTIALGVIGALMFALTAATVISAKPLIGTTQSYTGTVSPASPTFSVPPYDDTAAPLTSITVTLTTTLTRSYGIVELEGVAPGIVIFNADNTFQGANLTSPFGGLVASGREDVPPVTVQCAPLGMVPSVVDTPIVWTSTQTTTVNPDEFVGGGPKVFTASYPSHYTVVHQSGVTRARQNALLSTQVTVRYN